MALVCPSCGTENRTVAKFCIECIGALPSTFAPTEVAPLLHAPAATRSEDMPSALIAFASTAPQRVAAASEPMQAKTVAQPVARQEVQHEHASQPQAPRDKATETRKGLWVSVAAFGIALFIGAAGWMIAGAGGWYIYSSGANVEEAGAAKGLPSPVAKAAMPGPVVALATLPATAEVVVAPVAVQAPEAPVQVAAADTARVAAPPLAPVEVKSEKATHAAASPHPNRKPSPDTKSPESTQPALAKCERLGFIAASRCKVEQCSKPQFQGRAECGPVLAQQRLMEQKRNPTMFN